MDVQKKLDEIVGTVGSARSMPMSASCVVNRAELLAMLEEVRAALPGSLAQAQELLGGRDRMVEEARAEAERIIQSAHAERGSLVSGTEVARRSQEEADRILAEARREAEEIRAEADDYVDSKLANFEVVLTKTLGSVDRGREKLLGRGPGLDEHGYADEDAPEHSTDPATLRERADAYVDTKLGAFEAVLAKTLDAVGRGRQKLHGRHATDELGAHLAAQDGMAHSPQTSDAEYLAGLADSQEQPHQPQQPQTQPQAQPELQPQQDYYATAAAYQQDPYGYQQQTYAQQDAYGYQQQDAYAYQQPYDPNAGYGHQQQQQHQQQPEQHQPPAAALDETSLFDTSMIDLDQLRQYEQGR
ncbi:ATP synthase F0 subunit B [Streptomyces sp. 7N604]|uniref:ATP synthase F0 subunit B n=1 Tax=Streptomyces sp. 7N604 TaxID=3457415 RepID=UPI003FD27667